VWVVAGVLAAIAIAIAVTTLGGGGSGVVDPDAFYAQPDPLPDGAAGAILRSAPVADPPGGAKAFRILYRSVDYRGRPAALSALLFVPVRPAPADGRNVVAVTHGTVGIAPSCGVSRGRSFFAHVDGLARFIRAGYAVVVPDYEGLGTRGPHPYLIGDATARATLDAVRATRSFKRAGASERFIVWGIGQGGHAALFTGQEADDYAPELELAGVAAAAPFANIGRLLKGSRDTASGRVLAAYTLASWSRLYPQVDLDELVDGPSRDAIDELARRCVPADHAPIRSALGGQKLKLAYRAKDPWAAQPLKSLLARNVPGATAIPVPVIITQGTDDRLVRPGLTTRFVRYLCAQGTTVQYRASRTVAHTDVGEKTAPYVSKWIVGRFAGEAARTTC
jgi:alpha-beta hydrolase superfamily lysophospholipase